MHLSPLVDELVRALRCLPGVGAKTAQRMALQLLGSDREPAMALSRALAAAAERVGRCGSCRTLSEDEQCAICASHRRRNGQICVVESPADIAAIESAASYGGQYFVLLGRLSPLDGMGPAELGIDRLVERLKNEQLSELILATNLTVEGEATAHYIHERASSLGVLVSRIAHGIPLGGELDYVGGDTLAHALRGRKPL